MKESSLVLLKWWKCAVVFVATIFFPRIDLPRPHLFPALFLYLSIKSSSCGLLVTMETLCFALLTLPSIHLSLLSFSVSCFPRSLRSLPVRNCTLMYVLSVWLIQTRQWAQGVVGSVCLSLHCNSFIVRCFFSCVGGCTLIVAWILFTCFAVCLLQITVVYVYCAYMFWIRRHGWLIYLYPPSTCNWS